VRRRCHLVALLAVALGAAALAGCGGDDETATTEPATTVAQSGAGVTVTVQALDNSFRPETLTVAAGTEVVFENRGRNDHNVLPADGGDSWGVMTESFRPGDAYRHTFTEPGEYPYYCSIHGTAEVGMVGTIVVTG
jgi:plastocyanin